MSPFSAAVDQVLVAVSSASIERLEEALSEVVDRLPSARPPERDDALRRMAEVMPNSPAGGAALLSLGCGAIVEAGGDPLFAFNAVLAQLTLAFREAMQTRDAQRIQRQSTGEPPRFFFDTTGPTTRPDDVEDVLEAFCRAAIAMLARSPEARRVAGSRTELRSMLESLSAERDLPLYLSELLDVLDDETVMVFHPAEKLGFEVRIRGIADNFQLHTLLAAALIGDPFQGWISGRPVLPRVAVAARNQPPPEGVLAESRFDLFHWHGLQADGTLPVGWEGSEHWIWLENRPIDIEPLDGMRIILLGPPTRERTWNPARRFDAMHAELTVEAQLPRTMVDVWLQRMAAALHRPGT